MFVIKTLIKATRILLEYLNAANSWKSKSSLSSSLFYHLFSLFLHSIISFLSSFTASFTLHITIPLSSFISLPSGSSFLLYHPLSFASSLSFSFSYFYHPLLFLFFIITLFLPDRDDDSLTSALLARARSNKQRNEYFIAMYGRHVGATFAECRFIIPGAVPMIRKTKHLVLQITMKT